MKTQNFKTVFFALTISAFGFLTSCEQEEDFVEESNALEVTEEVFSEIEAKSGLSRVGRYFQGGGNSLHTYNVGYIGSRIGNREGYPFQLGIYNKSVTPTPPAGTTQLYFLLSPGNRDFVLTTNRSERSRLLRLRWRDVSEYNFSLNGIYFTNQSAYIHTSGGSGRVRLYRFYGASNTDHLFTTNYNEGVNAGYTYEGVVGWVHR